MDRSDRETIVRKLPAIAAAFLLSLTAGCGERPATADTTGSTAIPAPAAPVDPGALGYDCQAETSVAVLVDGTARVTLPGGERHELARVAGSDPAVYAGDSLYFTVGADAAYLSQQDGTRELACSRTD